MQAFLLSFALGLTVSLSKSPVEIHFLKVSNFPQFYIWSVFFQLLADLITFPELAVYQLTVLCIISTQ